MNYLPNDAAKIPNILWQTYRSSDIPAQAKPLIKSWLDSNPNLEWYFMDDARCDQFINDHFDQEFYDMYKSLPVGVMRADVWRAAVIYVYGGIYADTDCHCMVPISTWIAPTDRLVVAVEVSNGALANFVFAAEPKHPAILSVLNNFLKLFKSSNFLNSQSNTPIQDFGQYGFSAGILDYYSLNDPGLMHRGGTTNFYNEVPAVQADCTKFILQQDNRITNGYAATSYVAHAVASFSWSRTPGYASWRVEQKRKLNK